jgi:hypothetical protein
MSAPPDSIIVISDINEPDQYRRLETELAQAATIIRKNGWYNCDLKVRYDMGGRVSVEVVALD